MIFPSGTLLLFGIVLALFLMQSIGGYFQIKDYKKTISRVHKLGNVGLGQKKGKFFSGHIVMIACNSEGIITGGEVLDGVTFLAKFHPIANILGKEHKGKSIYEFLDDFQRFEPKKQKQYQGYIRALEALQLRLNGDTN